MKLSILKQYIRIIAVLLVFAIYSVALVAAGREIGTSSVGSENKQTISDSSGLKKPLPSENVQSGAVLPGNVKLCANTEFSYELRYPTDWFTTYTDKKDECAYFAPYSFVAPMAPDDYFTPITLKLIPKDEWDSTVDSFRNPSDLYSVLSFKNLEINSRPVKLIEAVSTGNLQPRGFQKVTYLVFDSETPIELTYFQQAQDDDLVNFRKVLEEMVGSLRYF